MEKKKAKPYKTHHTTVNVVAEPAIEMTMSDIFHEGVSELIDTARNGISMRSLLGLSEKLSLSLQDLGKILHLSLRTLQRYAPSKKLDTDASAKALQLAALHKRGLEVFGSDKGFNAWLRTEVPAMEGKRPIDFLDTPFGFQLLFQHLGRIEQGIFS